MSLKTSDNEVLGTFRANRSGYIGFGIIALGITGMSVSIFHKDPRPATAALVAFCAALAIFVFVWLRAFALEVTPDALTYRSLTQRRSVRREEIRDIRLSFEPRANRWGPTVRLTVRIKNDEPLIINAKVFSREAIRTVRALAPARAGTEWLEKVVAPR